MKIRHVHIWPLFLAASLAVACFRPGIPGLPQPLRASVPAVEEPIGLSGAVSGPQKQGAHGSLALTIRWPRRIHAIPASTRVVRLEVRKDQQIVQADGKDVALEVFRPANDATSSANLQVPTGGPYEVLVGAFDDDVARDEAHLVASGKVAVTVRSNEAIALKLSLTPRAATPEPATPAPGESPTPAATLPPDEQTPTPGPRVTPPPEATPDPTPTPDALPTLGPTPTPGPTQQATPPPDATPAPTPTPDALPTLGPTPTPAPPKTTPTPEPTPSPTPTPDALPTLTPTPTPTPTPAPTPTPEPTPSWTSVYMKSGSSVVLNTPGTSNSAGYPTDFQMVVADLGDQDLSPSLFVWTSSNANVASVSVNGLVWAVSPSSTEVEIKATAKHNSVISTAATVRVRNDGKINLTID